MPNNVNSDIWLVGAGAMAIEYAKVFEKLEMPYSAIGRSEEGVQRFKAATGNNAYAGGIDTFLNQRPEVAAKAIVAVPVEFLKSTVMSLIEYGVGSILVEKPAALTIDELKEMEAKAVAANCHVYVAYNRRFFSSVQTLKTRLQAETLLSCNFEFTEWAHVIEKLDKPKEVLNHWLWANSSHVIDLAFFIAGMPDKQKSSHFIHGNLAWHPSGAIFSGAGITKNQVIYQYNANWLSAGRWRLDFSTSEGRYLLEPMETLQFQKKGTIKPEPVEIDNAVEEGLKPGLLKMVESFCNECEDLPTLEEQISLCEECDQMAGYTVH